MVEGISTVEEAYAAAKAEMGLNPEAAPEQGVGASTPPAPAPLETGADQPSTNPETQALVDSMLEQPAEGEEATLPPGFWNQTVEVDGEQVQLNDLRNGYLRHADYTRKTQALADQRRTLEAAASFYEDFSADPQDFAKRLAVQYGWIDNEDLPLREVEVGEQLTQEEWDARIDQIVDERIEADPRIDAANRAQAEQMINAEFSRLEGEFGVTLHPELRDSLLSEAAERQVYDLELLLRARINAQMDKQKASQHLARSGPSRPNAGGGLGSDPMLGQDLQPETVEEAWAQAKAEQIANR